ncbi:MAG TPA: DUF6194 family protein [Streptosporangiaceae bacterium]|jgi:hypothetical protein
MTAEKIIAFVTGLPGVAAVTASEASGAPEAAWGDSFFFYDPEDNAASRRMPFATTVTQDYDGWDTASDLNRPGVFRLNIAVGRAAFEKLTGYPPGEHDAQAVRFDYTALDRLLPHPAYAAQGWVAILDPGDATAAQARSLLTDAHALAVQRRDRRR